MPGVQGKYTIDVTNRFGLAVDEDDQEVESDVENVDPFEMLNQANKAAETAKSAPKPKKKPAPAKPAAVVEEKKRTTNVQKDVETDEAVAAEVARTENPVTHERLLRVLTRAAALARVTGALKKTS